MKRYSSIIFCLLLSINQSNAQRKIALMIAINEYKVSTQTPLAYTKGRNMGWSNLYGCVNDITAFSQILKSRYDFAEDNIKKITDRDATRSAILNNLSCYLQN